MKLLTVPTRKALPLMLIFLPVLGQVRQVS